MTEQTPMADPTVAIDPWPSPQELAASYPPRPVAMLKEEPGKPASLALILSQDRDDGWLPVRIAAPGLAGLLPGEMLIHRNAIARRFDGVPHPEAVDAWSAYDAMRAAAQSREEV